MDDSNSPSQDSKQVVSAGEDLRGEEKNVQGQPAGQRGRGRFIRFKPLRIGEEIEVKIEKKGEKGDGIATIKGLVLFVPGGEVGMDCRVKVVRVFRNFAVGEIIA